MFLGNVIDSVAGEPRLPLEKLGRLRLLIQQWLGKKRELLSIVGRLQHAATVVRLVKRFGWQNVNY